MLVGVLPGFFVSALAVGAEGVVPTASSSVASIAGASAVSHSLSEGFDFAVLGQLLAGLVLVLVLFLGLAWLLKRTGVAGGFSHQGLKVLATLPLSTRERLVLVQAGSKQLLLGVAPGRVNLLESFDQPLVDESKGTQAPFSNWLQRAMIKTQGAKRSVGAHASNGVDDVGAKPGKSGGVVGE
jgi:flagellar protein FliO/FliZ